MPKARVHSSSEFLKQGRNFLAQGKWEQARRFLEKAVQFEETPETLEELGFAASWCEDGAATFNARERAYSLYHSKGNISGAARLALVLVLDYLEFRGSYAIANGWLQRARRLLLTLPLCFEHGLLSYIEGYIAIHVHKDVAAARDHGGKTVSISEKTGNADLEMLGRALEGFSYVINGQVEHGMNLLDESAAIVVAGEAKDINAICYAFCHMICACEQVRDYDRAYQWCFRVREFCKKWRIKSFFAYCRTRYASILISRGDWTEAETELLSAEKELAGYRPGLIFESTVHLAELRRKQGKLGEASAMFKQAQLHPRSFLGRSAIALDEGDYLSAIEFAGDYLRHPSTASRTERIGGLEILIRTYLAIGNLDQAREHLAELEETARLMGSDQARALISYLNGLFSSNRGDQESARGYLADAADMYERTVNPYETGQVRFQLALVYRSLGRIKRAYDEARKALNIWQALGVKNNTEKVHTFLDELTRNMQPAGSSPPGLTTPLFTHREEELLRLIITGMSNEKIAKTLFLSVRTVERHISNIYQKIGVTGKTARAAAVAFALRNGLS